MTKSLYPYYSDPHKALGDRARKVSFDRPGIEGHGPDGRGSDSPFAAYEYPFVRWLEMNGFEVEYCTSVDLHADPHFLDNYQLLLSVGHDEYWSKEMRDSVEAFIAAGGNVAFFSGNVCWWQVRFEDNNRTMVCYKYEDQNETTTEDPVIDPQNPDPIFGFDPSRATVYWYHDPVNRPGNRMTGVDFRKGAYWSQGNLPGVTYRVQFPQHWVFDTALGGSTEFTVGQHVGYDETDGVELSDYTGATPPRATGDDGTPLNFICLAIADGQDWTARSGGKSGWATMGIFRNNGTVFTAATINWADGLAHL